MMSNGLRRHGRFNALRARATKLSAAASGLIVSIDGSVVIKSYRIDIAHEKEAKLAVERTAINHRNRIGTLSIMTWVANESGELIEVNQAWRDHAGIHISTRNDFGEIVAPDRLAAFLDQWAFCVETSEIMDTRTTDSDAITRTDCDRHILALPMTFQS